VYFISIARVFTWDGTTTTPVIDIFPTLPVQGWLTSSQPWLHHLLFLLLLLLLFLLSLPRGSSRHHPWYLQCMAGVDPALSVLWASPGRQGIVALHDLIPCPLAVVVLCSWNPWLACQPHLPVWHTHKFKCFNFMVFSLEILFLTVVCTKHLKIGLNYVWNCHLL